MNNMIGMKMENELLPDNFSVEMEDCLNCGHSIEHTPHHWDLYHFDNTYGWCYQLVSENGNGGQSCEDFQLMNHTGYSWSWTKSYAIFLIRNHSEAPSLPIHVTQKNGIVKVIN
jgi:hypothetical protein